MKLKRQTKFNKVLRLKLFKHKIYVTDNNFNFNIQLKINFKLVFKYFLCNKKIFLIGSVGKINKLIFKIIKSTNCFYIPHNLWFNGLLTNSKIIFKYLVFSKKLSKLMKFLFNLNNDLILIFKNNFNFNELLSLKNAPIVSFNKHVKFYDYLINFKKQKKIENIFFYFFEILLKKAKFFKFTQIE